jgi:rare lipoprotein A
MRPMSHSRARRALPALCGLACLVPAVSAVSAASASTDASTSAAKSATVSAHLSHNPVRWGDAAKVYGRVTSGASRQLVALQFRKQGSTQWRTLATAHTKKRSYRFAHVLPSRGTVRVVLGDGSARGVRADATGGLSSAAAYAAGTSRGRSVRIRSAIGFESLHTTVTPGGKASVKGHVLPRRAGRLVIVRRNAGHGWSQVARTRSRHNGSFRLTWRPGANARVRVETGGDKVASGSTRDAGRVTLQQRMRNALASTYDDYGGPLACSNGTLGYSQIGVANKSLPCGTKVTIRYRGRTVVAPVIDRGPYVGNREFDLTGATARKLHFGGVGTIQVAY